MTTQRAITPWMQYRLATRFEIGKILIAPP
jgi:hypothetical protein